MQPHPSNGPPGASGPPPSGPNMFRRTRPFKHAAPTMATMPPSSQPMTDPFGFVRAPPPMAAGGLPTLPTSTPPLPPTNTVYSQPGAGLLPPPQINEVFAAAPSGPPPISLPGVAPFNPSNAASSGVYPAPSLTGYASSNNETGYFNSREQMPSNTPEQPPIASVPAPSQTPLNQEFQRRSTPQPVPFQPLPPTTSALQWSPDHRSRPPSVQNYFQPTNDPPPQAFNIQPQPRIYPSNTPSPLRSAPAPTPQHGQPPVSSHPPHSMANSSTSQWSVPNVPLLNNTHFQSQSYMTQSTASPESWFNHPPQDSGYHQMGTRPEHQQPNAEPPPPPVPDSGPPHSSTSASVPYSHDSGSLTMFFNNNDVENEETLCGERKKPSNGIPESSQHYGSTQAGDHVDSGLAGVALEYQGCSPHDGSNVPNTSDGTPPQEIAPGAHVSHYDHVENLECVPNQEVLPSDKQVSPAASATQEADTFETGPNLETPDSIPRPVRSASVSSNYSNMSHGSATGTRRHQGVVGTFIQQESPRLTEDATLSAATGGYFEQIDTSPAGDMGLQQSALEQMWQPTPSPPKPTGVFQASANSSFEPVRSHHGVGVRPVEVDRAKMVVECAPDPVTGNLEQPPDNMENIFGSGQSISDGAGSSGPPLTHPVVYSHSRPSSRSFGANRPCESPATTLWAQNDTANLGVNILLAPAAPTVLAPLREPSVDVIQPPEDAPVDPHPPQIAQTTPHPHLENLENPPKVSDGPPVDSQDNLGYASLLVSDSLHQPVLIAPPVSNYNAIPPTAHAQAATQPNPIEVNAAVMPPEPPNVPLFVPGQASFNSTLSANVPLNLTYESTAKTAPDSKTSSDSQQVRPAFSRGQSVSGDNHFALQGNSQSACVAPPISNQSQTTNYELLDFSMHQSQTQNQAPSNPSALHESPQPCNGFYLQVTKDAQQVARTEVNAPAQTLTSLSTTHVQPSQVAAFDPQPSVAPVRTVDAQPPQHVQSASASVPVGSATPSGHYSVQGDPANVQPPPAAAGPPAPAPSGAPLTSGEPPRPPSSVGSQQGYGPPPPGPGQVYGGYYGNYGEYYPPGHYAPGDPRAQQYYHDGSYRNREAWYGRYDGANPAYRDPNYQYREPLPERPSSRTSQYSDRPSSRHGYPEDYHRANQSAYDYYADYAKRYDYSGYNYGQYDPRVQPRGYYDQSYWSNYGDGYRNRDYYNQQMYPARKEGYDDQWRYYPGYDANFDEDYRRHGDTYGDDFDRRSVHSEQSAHSAHSSRSHHSRQSSFSSRSQQSQVYRSQPDLVSAVYDTTSSTLAVDYSYAQYPNQTDASQNYSQYLYPSEYRADSTWVAPEQPPPCPAATELFTKPHRCARFSPGGFLVQVLPNLPSDGQPALVDIHSMEAMLQDTQYQEELRSFPGPLVKEETHKVDVIKFCQKKALECSRDDNLLDRDSACLIWDFIVLLCRQNGTVVGTDIADLLLKEHRSVWLPGKSPNEANLIDFNKEPLSCAEEEPGAGPLSLLSDTFMTVPENVGKETERFRELLLFGRKKDALEAAMKGGLWGHALLLASKMDSRTHARVMTRFANSLPINDPLQTVYQLMSGRMPASATCCGEEKWGDWRPHLAMVLSNLTNTLDLDTRTITTMGDTLASKGLVEAAHFCYMMAQVEPGVFTKKSTKMVLIGANHSLPFHQCATNEAIQRTEAYEYAQGLGIQSCSLHNFQVFKLIYACRLAEAGLSAQAFHYCEVISRSILMQPSYYSPVLLRQVIQMSEKLRFFDPQMKERPEQELFNEPEWLVHIRQLDGQIRTGAVTYNADRASPTQLSSSSPSSDLCQPPDNYGNPPEVDGTTDNPLMCSLLPGPPPQEVQLMPPAPSSILQDGMAPPQHLPPNSIPQFYPVPPVPTTEPPGQLPVSPSQDPGSVPLSFQPPQQEMYPGVYQHSAPQPPQMGQMSPHIHPQMQHSPAHVNHNPAEVPSHMPSSPGHMPPVEQPPHIPLERQNSQPTPGSLPPQMDYYDYMEHMGPGRRSRTTSQSSVHATARASSRRSRTTSESSTHSGGRERSNSVAMLPSPPPIPEQPVKEQTQKAKKESPKKDRGGSWLNWFSQKRKNEAHLPDDKNKSIVWDKQKQRWIDLNEPEEESKPLPPPPTGIPKMMPMPGSDGPPGPPTGGPPVNMFSRKAGTKSRYVDVLNPGRTSKPSGLPPAPADIFATMAPMAMPTNLFVPSSAPADQQPLEGGEGGNQEQASPQSSAAPQMFNPTLLPPAPEASIVPDGSQSGELSRSSSMSSLSREVSQHLNKSHPAQVAPPTGGVTFYNPAQFAQTSAPSGGGVRPGRLGGQRQYPAMK
ncbi:protein transport protein Sec16A [Neosynchiropus ocellatus]